MSEPEKPRILVTGPGGRIGPHIVSTLRDHFNVRLLDKTPIAGEPDTILTDLQGRDVLVQAMTGCQAILHLAAQADEAPFVEQLVQPNVIGTYNVFEAARLAHVKRVVFASTIQTVGFNPERPVETTDLPRPVTTYACTKLLGEALGRFYHDAHGLEVVVVRIGWFQPYDSKLLRDNQACRERWLSPRDAAHIFTLALSKPGIGYAIVFATSITETEIISRKSLHEVLGYTPVDDVRELVTGSSPAG